MTYIDYLNRFNQFLESSALPPSAQLLYYKLLHVFNRAGWPPTVQVDNQRLGDMIGLRSESAIINARSKLVKAGFLQWKTGKNHSPNRYMLCEKEVWPSVNRSVDRSIDQSVDQSVGRSVGQSVGQSVGRSVDQSVGRSVDQSHIKNKTKNKTKTKTLPPNPPRGGSRPGPSYDIEALSAIAVLDLPDEL